MPGPASTVEEHSLRNFLFAGDRGSILAAGQLFSRDKIKFAKRIVGNPIRGHETLTQPTNRKNCCDNLLLYEEEHSLGNWSYDVTVSKRWAMTS